MSKARSRKDANIRSHIAYLAARLMAEDGVADYGAAKQKAARQAGLLDSKLLPDNQEIEAALREYQSLYQADDQPAQLRRMREVAVRVMREFSHFNPTLVGSVLSGTANKYSDVNLHLYADDSKALTLFLLNHRYRYEEGARRVRRGDGRCPTASRRARRGRSKQHVATANRRAHRTVRDYRLCAVVLHAHGA